MMELFEVIDASYKIRLWPFPQRVLLNFFSRHLPVNSLSPFAPVTCEGGGKPKIVSNGDKGGRGVKNLIFVVTSFWTALILYLFIFQISGYIFIICTSVGTIWMIVSHLMTKRALRQHEIRQQQIGMVMVIRENSNIKDLELLAL